MRWKLNKFETPIAGAVASHRRRRAGDAGRLARKLGEHLGYGSYSGGFRRNPADDGGLDAGPDGWREFRLQVKANP